MKLIETAKIKSILNLDNTDFDEIIDDINDGVGVMIEGLLGTKLKHATYTEVYDGDGYYLITNNYPLKTLGKFEIDIDGSWLEIENVKFKQNGVVGYKTPDGFQNVQVTYDAGYLIDWVNADDPAKHTLPHDLSEMGKRFVLRQYRKLNNEGEKTSNYTNSSLTWDDLVTKDDKMVIEKYRRLIVA